MEFMDNLTLEMDKRVNLNQEQEINLELNDH
jgi:hypothetical protein